MSSELLTEAVHIKEFPVPRLTRDHVIVALDYASVESWDANAAKGCVGGSSRGPFSVPTEAVRSRPPLLTCAACASATAHDLLLDGDRVGFRPEDVRTPDDLAQRA